MGKYGCKQTPRTDNGMGSVGAGWKTAGEACGGAGWVLLRGRDAVRWQRILGRVWEGAASLLASQPVGCCVPASSRASSVVICPQIRAQLEFAGGFAKMLRCCSSFERAQMFRWDAICFPHTALNPAPLSSGKFEAGFISARSVGARVIHWWKDFWFM